MRLHEADLRASAARTAKLAGKRQGRMAACRLLRQDRVKHRFRRRQHVVGNRASARRRCARHRHADRAAGRRGISAGGVGRRGSSAVSSGRIRRRRRHRCGHRIEGLAGRGGNHHRRRKRPNRRRRGNAGRLHRGRSGVTCRLRHARRLLRMRGTFGHATQALDRGSGQIVGIAMLVRGNRSLDRRRHGRRRHDRRHGRLDRGCDGLRGGLFTQHGGCRRASAGRLAVSTGFCSDFSAGFSAAFSGAAFSAADFSSDRFFGDALGPDACRRQIGDVGRTLGGRRIVLAGGLPGIDGRHRGRASRLWACW